MSINDQYKYITVFRDRENHILIYDSCYPEGRLPNQYYDIHKGEMRGVNLDGTDFTFEEIQGEQKQKACEIYMHWKWRDKKELVIKYAAMYFPPNGGFLPGCNPKPPEVRYKSIQPPKLINQPIASRSEIIKEFVRNRRIPGLFHFTHIDNLASILDLGLLSRKKVEELFHHQNLRVNDLMRIDGHTEGICLSISFPNYKMFYTYHESRQQEWVVIRLKPDLLWELDCAYCTENASSKNVKCISLENRKKVAALEKLFQDSGQITRKDLSIPEWFPTNPQAEVLVFDTIPLSYFLKIYFYDTASQSNWVANNSSAKKDLFAMEGDYFSPRCDYKSWQKQLVNVMDNSEFSEELPY